MNPLNEKILEMLLAGTPAHVVETWTAMDPDARAEVDALRETLASMALSLDPVAPSASLRDRLRASIDAHPRSPRRAAVLVVDMLRDHLTEGSALEVPRARAIVPAMQARLAQARADHEPVIYVCDHHEPGDPDLEVWTSHNLRAPKDDVWPELAPTDADHIVTHRAYSGFFETELDAVLRSLDVNTLVVTGCITEIHVFATATDALQRGYKVEVPIELQAGSSPEVERTILGVLSIMVPSNPLFAHA